MELYMPLTSPFLQGRALCLRRHSALTLRHNSSLLQPSNLHLKRSTKFPHHATVPNGLIRSFPSLARAAPATNDGDSFPVHAQVGGSKAAETSDPILTRSVKFLCTIWTFLGPYTIRGTFLAATSWAARVYLKHLQGQPLPPSLILKALSGLLALLCAQGYIAGINQIYDVEIDKINKPSRPLPSGDMSLRTAWILTISMPVVGFLILMANMASPLLFALYSLSIFLCTAYSVRPFRFKETPLAANLTIAVLRGVLINSGTYLALRATIPFPLPWRPPMTFTTIFSSILAFVFGIIKDLPDVEGDRMHGIFTPAVTLGQRTTTFLGTGIIMMLYIAGVAAPICMPQYFNGMVMIPANIILASSLAVRVWLLGKSNYGQKECHQFYMFLWNLYYAQQILFPFM